ncbi:ABC transporter ATP-binding protein [Rothia nasisuis]|uniref:ABC transporter ATP-binding protein n=1 Tax=Rothia nasisuis TaxID=2109647 RepID=UPI001F1B5928|nr:ABC transporter ATP-binding protein [Rothia nasisuis]
MHARFEINNVTLAYDQRVISKGLTLRVPAQEFTVIVGANACGKSTLLKSLARIIRPTEGTITLDQRDLHSLKSKEVARSVGFLSQNAIAPEKMVVRDLVARGRAPHQSIIRQWSSADYAAVEKAMELTKIAELQHRHIDELSGGQQQRVWIAMVLAQDTETILLDEPTTFLDLRHQIEILELCKKLHREENRTIVAVLHDLNQAVRYATHLIAMNDGAVLAQGPAHDVVTEDTVEKVFGLRTRIIEDPVSGTPLVIPLESGSYSTSPASSNT